jgi:hypothetical protein
MNPLDHAVLGFLNSYAGRSVIFDNFCSLLGQNILLKGGIFVFLFWWLWFRKSPEQAKAREFLLLGTIAPIVAVFAARVVSHLLPFRERPLRVAELHFRIHSSNCRVDGFGEPRIS